MTERRTKGWHSLKAFRKHTQTRITMTNRYLRFVFRECCMQQRHLRCRQRQIRSAHRQALKTLNSFMTKVTFSGNEGGGWWARFMTGYSSPLKSFAAWKTRELYALCRRRVFGYSYNLIFCSGCNLLHFSPKITEANYIFRIKEKCMNNSVEATWNQPLRQRVLCWKGNEKFMRSAGEKYCGSRNNNLYSLDNEYVQRISWWGGGCADTGEW